MSISPPPPHAPAPPDVNSFRVKLVALIARLASAILLFFGPIYLWRGDLAGLSITAIACLFFVGLYLVLRKNPRPEWFAAGLTVVVALLLLIGGALGFTQVYLWTICMPPVLFFLVGERSGLVFTAITASILIAAVTIWPVSAIPLNIELTLVASYSAVGLVVLFYERLRTDYETQLVFLMTHDVLTGAWNRRSFEETLQRVCTTPGTRLALLLIDVDFFKEVNDRFGHSAGDVVLQQICRAIQRCLVPGERLVRLGGDEFAVLIPTLDTHGEDEADIAGEFLRRSEQLRCAVAELRFEFGGTVSITLGSAVLAAGEQPEQFYERADAALYAAKRCGRDTSCVSTASGWLTPSEFIELPGEKLAS